jgi:hypothetical protein
MTEKELNKESWEMNYINACLYFYVVRNTHNQKYSIQYRTTKHFDFTQSKYEIVKELPGIRFTKYESFEKRYWEYYEKYCVEHNKSISNK